MLFQCTELRQLLGLHISYPPWKKRVVRFFLFFPSLSLFFSVHWFTSLDPLWIGKKGREKRCFICQQKGGKWSMANAHSSCGQFFFKFYTNRHFCLLYKQLRKCRCPDHRNLCMYICWLLNGFRATDVQHGAEEKVCRACNWFLGECGMKVSVSQLSE